MYSMIADNRYVEVHRVQYPEQLSMVNENFDPSKQEREVLNVLTEEYQVNPYRIREVTRLQKQRVNDALSSLEAAGWVEKPSRGLYRLVYDGEYYVDMELVREKNP